MNNTLKNYTNKEKAHIYKRNYDKWKEDSLKTSGFFVIFNGFIDNGKLKKISGNGLKLYIFLGIKSKNMTGEVWYSNRAIAKYFNKTERTIRSWMKELEDLNLIIRMQLEFNGEAHTYLQPYLLNNKNLNDD